MAKVVLVGLGNMGRKYLRKLLELGIKPTLCDINENLRKEFGNFEFYCFFDEINPSGEEKVIVAVDPHHHPTVATHFLKAGAEVLLEKPPAPSAVQFKKLLDEVGGEKLRVSEIERYSYAVRGLKVPKDLKKVQIRRLNSGKGYINPIWDLAWHDFYLLLHLFGEVEIENLKRVSEYRYVLSGRVGKNVPFSLEVAWNHPSVDRSWTLETSKGEIFLDFLNERRTEFGRITSERKDGDKLLEMVSDFLNGTYDGKSTKRALRILEILEKVETKEEI